MTRSPIKVRLEPRSGKPRKILGDPQGPSLKPYQARSGGVEVGCWKVVNQMSYLTVGSLENTSRLVDVSLNWTINSTG